MKSSIFLVLLIILFTGCATWKGIKQDSNDAWEATKEGTSKAYNKTKEAINEATE